MGVILLIVPVLNLLGVISTWPSTSKQEGAGEYVADVGVTTTVKTAVLSGSSLKSGEINVEAFKGVVQLSGFVSSQADINKAAEVARSVNGVKSVKNDMRLT